MPVFVLFALVILTAEELQSHEKVVLSLNLYAAH
jgi:hypothetical protein